MRKTICVVLLVNCIILIAATHVGQDSFVPKSDKIHYGRRGHPRQWGRWCVYDSECGLGFCQAYMCQCYYGYITWYYMEPCSYEQRSKLTAFLLSFFVGPFGVDWFFLSRGNAGYIIAGIVKLFIALGCCIGWPFVYSNKDSKSRQFVSCGSFICAVCTTITIIWWLTDWIRVLAHVFHDGNGAPLLRWGYDNYYGRIPYRP